ncbi:MAG: signal recognition particle receptor subunit alpha, partial [Actinobacteria bacterium]|nr:signal recognition particle receptor subunit alpha [Actinomycetota bacterium]
MFGSLTEKISKTLQSLRGRGRLTAEDIDRSGEELRQALLEADVALEVVQDFIATFT